MEAYAIRINRPSRLPGRLQMKCSVGSLHLNNSTLTRADNLNLILSSTYAKSSMCKRLEPLHTMLNVMALWKDSIVHCYTCWPQQPKNTPSFDWEDQIRKVCVVYNTSVQAFTGYTAFIMMFELTGLACN